MLRVLIISRAARVPHADAVAADGWFGAGGGARCGRAPLRDEIARLFQLYRGWEDEVVESRGGVSMGSGCAAWKKKNAGTGGRAEATYLFEDGVDGEANLRRQFLRLVTRPGGKGANGA